MVCSGEAAMTVSADAVFAKIRWRILPLLTVCYFIAFIDRVNVSLAALSMNQELHFTPVIYSWGAGIFFFGYFLFEVPSNLILERIGARVWIARIMVTWGILSILMATVRGPTSFYVIRFLLGAAEAGFYPGIMLYLTYWFPQHERARVTAWFFVAAPIASALGGPISGALLGLQLASLHGWQWLFIVEGAPALILGVVVWAVLRDRPDDAPWLTAPEREVLAAKLAADRAARANPKHLTLWQGLREPRILLLSAIYFGCVAGNYGLTFWLPQIIKGFGASNFQTGLIFALPYALGAVALILWSMHSDRTGERIAHVVIPLALVTAALLLSSQLTSPAAMMAVLCVAGIGIFANVPPFWTLPTSVTVGTGAAGGIALVNSIGNLSGFLAPYLIGVLKESTGGFGIPLAVLAIFPFAAMILTLRIRRLQPAPTGG
jgi:MFS transporter, ACS family, tartrate transporter